MSMKQGNIILLQKTLQGTSLIVQWLGICLPMQGTWVQFLVRKLRSHMQQSVAN